MRIGERRDQVEGRRLDVLRSHLLYQKLNRSVLYSSFHRLDNTTVYGSYLVLFLLSSRTHREIFRFQQFFFFFDRWIVLDSMIMMDSVVVVISISILMNADRNWISIVKIVEIWLEKPNNVENVPIIHCRYTSNSISI